MRRAILNTKCLFAHRALTTRARSATSFASRQICGSSGTRSAVGLRCIQRTTSASASRERVTPLPFFRSDKIPLNARRSFLFSSQATAFFSFLSELVNRRRSRPHPIVNRSEERRVGKERQ